MTNPITFNLPSEVPVMTFQQTVEILDRFRRDPETYNLPDLLDAITVALFVLRLLERGDFTYEPLS